MSKHKNNRHKNKKKKTSLPEFVRATLTEKNLKPIQVAINSGNRISVPTIHNLMGGSTPNPHVQTLDALAAGMDEDYCTLCLLAVNRPADPNAHGDLTSQMIRAFERLPDDLQPLALAVLRAMDSEENYGAQFKAEE